MSKDNRRFNRAGKYQCANCGKITRETGEGESSVGFCKKCYIIGGQENAHTDGHSGKIRECAKCKEDLESCGYSIEDADTWCDNDGDPEPPYGYKNCEECGLVFLVSESTACEKNRFCKSSCEDEEIERLDMIKEEEKRISGVELHQEWCTIGGCEFLSYPEDGECTCGEWKHHVHCQHGNIIQSG